MAAPKIIIVQNDFLLAEELRIILDDAGYEVVGLARDTAAAEDLVKQHRPALAIVDLMLEIDVDGVATATVLEQRHGLKILITTGFPESFMEREGIPDLACDIARKPYTDDEILEAVARCLSGTGAQRS
jgi:two-component system, response regulator PdtaR